MTLTIYHNNKCSKSRTCIKLLEQEKVPFIIREYLKNPLSFKEIKHLIKYFEGDIKALIRIPIPKLDQSELIKFVYDNQKLLERPIAFNGIKYLVCRPPTNCLEMMND